MAIRIAQVDQLESYPPSAGVGEVPALYSLESEMSLLGAVLIDSSVLPEIEIELSDFHDLRHKLIWRAISAILADGGQVTNITVADFLEKNKKLEEAGGPGYLAQLTLSTSFNTIGDETTIKEFSRRRQLLAIYQEGARSVITSGDAVDPDWAISRLTPLRNNGDHPEERHKSRWTVAELLDSEFPEPKWSIPDLIPEGLTIIGGRPKVGKSWLLLQAAIAVGSGGMFFGKRVEQGNVLYVAFEDGPRRLQDRIRKMGMPREACVRFERKWKPMQDGGIDDLVIELAAADYRLVIFDTLTRSFPGLSQTQHPEVIGQCIDEIQSIATNRSLSIAFSDHTRKPNGFDGDPVDDILYSSEKVKGADVVMALYKEQGKAGAKLLGRGRDIGEIDLALYWDPETWCWQCQGNGEDVALTERMTEVLDAVRSFKKARMIDIAKATGINK